MAGATAGMIAPLSKIPEPPEDDENYAVWVSVQKQYALFQAKDAMDFETFCAQVTGSAKLAAQMDYLWELQQGDDAPALDILLDSNGSYDFSADMELLDAIDGVMLDVKAWNADEHDRLTGASNDIVLKNLRFLAETGKLTEVRTVAVPEWMNAAETVREVSRLLRALRAENTRYKLIRFRPMGVLQEYRSLRVPTDDEMRALEAIAHENGVRNTVLI